MNKQFFRAVKSEFRIRKAFALLLLVLCIVFFFYEITTFEYGISYLQGTKIEKLDKPKAEIATDRFADLSDVEQYAEKIPQGEIVHLKGNNTVEQKFTADESKLKRIRICFFNPKYYEASGKVYVSVLGSDGKTVAKAWLDANLIQNRAPTNFDFTQNNEEINSTFVLKNKVTTRTSNGYHIKKGKLYTLKIVTENIKSTADFDVYLGKEAYTDGSLTINGKDYGKKRLLSAVNYMHKPMIIILFLLTCLVLTMILILLPLFYLSKKLSVRIKRKTDLNRLLLKLLFILTTPFCFWMTLRIVGKSMGSVIRTFPTITGILTILILIMVWWTIYAVTNRMRITSIITVFICFAFSMTNYFLILFRNSPLTANDFSSVGTAMDVAANYTLTFSKSSMWVISLTVIYLALLISLKGHRGPSWRKEWKKRVRSLCIAGVMIGLFCGVLLSTNFMSNRGIFISAFNQKKGYHKHGSVICFTYSLKNSRIKKPKNYSVKNAAKIAEKFKSDEKIKTASVSEKTPNIIVIMNEAYTDLQYVNKFTTSADYMPFFHGLKENTIKGIMHPSVFGGRTANTEYEFLTGNTTAFYPMNSVPYTTNLKSKVPSITTTLKDQGYKGNIAFHPGVYNSYNRDKAYPNLGFEKVISLEDLKNPKMLRAYVSDQGDFEEVVRQYESFRKTGDQSPFFLFNVTIQNHSGFSVSSGYVEKKITITDKTFDHGSSEQYLNLIKKTDEALEYLVNYYKKKGEPTVIVMFGDHEPHVGEGFYDSLLGRIKDESELEIMDHEYRVPFMIWANYDIKEKQNEQISTNYLGPYLLNALNLKMTGYDKYLLDLRKQVPVFCAVDYIGADGVLYDTTKTSKYTKYLNRYNVLQYNNAVDTRHRLKNFFTLN
jgi:phosphoglycerol transferase MdoB-like AlkP superfamily enzyme